MQHCHNYWKDCTQSNLIPIRCLNLTSVQEIMEQILFKLQKQKMEPDKICMMQTLFL